MNKRNLSILSWTATAISLIGVMLNAWQSIWCWPVWCVGNLFWIAWAVKKKESSQIILWIVFTLFNIYGWYSWAK